MNDARVDITPHGWRIHNGCISLEIARLPEGGISFESLTMGGREWAKPGMEAGITLLGEKQPYGIAEWGYSLEGDGTSADLPGGGVELVLLFAFEEGCPLCYLIIRCFPGIAALEFFTRLEWYSDYPVPLAYAMWPLSLPLGGDGAGLTVNTQDAQGRHGFYPVGAMEENGRIFDNWIVLEDAAAGEAMLIGGDMGAGVLRFSAAIAKEAGGVRLRAGANAPPSGAGEEPSEIDPAPRWAKTKPSGTGEEPSAIDPAPGMVLETPLVFLALSQGGPDEVANEAFRYLKRHVMPEPLAGSPFATYGVWFTRPDSEELMREELLFARRVGFDVFCHDASWMAGSSQVPGMNDFTCGLGSYAEDTAKFPHGLADMSRRIHDAGMKFGIWVDPPNVDILRVAAGEFPRSWLAMKQGKILEFRHPSLSPTNQLCLGHPEVVAWLKEQLTDLIERYALDYMKWDPSGTVSYACDCPEHGHGAHGGTWAVYAGQQEIWAHLLTRYPEFTGFECGPSLRYSRLNPGPRALLPGGYTCEFMAGPMVAPYVMGSLATVKTIDSVEISELTSGWCSASTLDYSLRRHLVNGIAFGNINAMCSQLLSKAPPGYIEAFMRNLYHFKMYRHLLFGNVWHPALADTEGWTAIEYTAEDTYEAVLFVFRHKGGAPENTVRLKALDPAKTYVLTSLNDRPGRERRVTGSALAEEGLAFALPEPWLAKGDWFDGAEYESQLEFGSDIILIREA